MVKMSRIIKIVATVGFFSSILGLLAYKWLSPKWLWSSSLLALSIALFNSAEIEELKEVEEDRKLKELEERVERLEKLAESFRKVWEA